MFREFQFTQKKFIIYIIIFFAIYGMSRFHATQFSAFISDENPFTNIQDSYIQESPITFFMGYALSYVMPILPINYAIVHLLPLLLFYVLFVRYLKQIDVPYDIGIKALILGPILLILFTWLGKSDAWLLSGFMMCMVSRRYWLFQLGCLLMVFSHVHAFYIYIFLSFLLQLKFRVPTYQIVLSILVALGVYAFYVSSVEFGDNRLSYILDHVKRIALSNFKAPIFHLFLTFGWLFFLLFRLKNEISWRAWLAALACLGVTFVTLDFTRVFMFLSFPFFIYLLTRDGLKREIRFLYTSFPFLLLSLIQGQIRPDGDLVDSTWFWYYKVVPKVLEYLSI